MGELQELLKYFKNYPFLIQLVWILSGFLFLTIIVVTIILKDLRGHLRRKAKFKTRLLEKYESLLLEFLYSDESNENSKTIQLNIVDQLKKASENKFKQKIIIEAFVKLRNEISGEMSEAIKSLYLKTELHHEALEKLHSKKWNVIATGIREATQFHISEFESEVVKHLNHPRKEVRNEVQLYLINLFNFKGLLFLDTLKNSLSEWDQIQLLEVLQRFNNQDLPDISKWLKSSNNSVVSFALKLALIYNRFETIETLLELLKHQNKEIRIETIQVLSYFQIPEAKSILKKDFKNVDVDEKIAILKLYEATADLQDQYFLNECVKIDNFEIKELSLRILNSVAQDRFQKVKNEAEDVSVSKIIEFIERA